MRNSDMGDAVLKMVLIGLALIVAVATGIGGVITALIGEGWFMGLGVGAIAGLTLIGVIMVSLRM